MPNVTGGPDKSPAKLAYEAKQEAKRRQASPEIRDYVGSLGVPSSFIAFGFGVVLQAHFYYGVAALLIGLLLSCSALDRTVLRYRAAFPRFTIQFTWIAIASLFLWFFVFAPAKLELSASSKVPVYGPGTEVHGIKWESEYAQLEFWIKNKSDDNYDRFSVTISTDQNINAIRQMDGSTNCLITTSSPHADVGEQRMTNGKPVGPMKEAQGDYAIVPIYPNGETAPPLGTDSTFLISCDRLPPEGHVDFVAATTRLKAQPSMTLYDSASPAKVISAEINFDQSSRPRTINFSRCEVGSQCEASRRFDSPPF